MFLYVITGTSGHDMSYPYGAPMTQGPQAGYFMLKLLNVTTTNTNSESSYNVQEIKKALIYKVKTSEKGHTSKFRSKGAKLM